MKITGSGVNQPSHHLAMGLGSGDSCFLTCKMEGGNNLPRAWVQSYIIQVFRGSTLTQFKSIDT